MRIQEIDELRKKIGKRDYTLQLTKKDLLKEWRFPTNAIVNADGVLDVIFRNEVDCIIVFPSKEELIRFAAIHPADVCTDPEKFEEYLENEDREWDTDIICVTYDNLEEMVLIMAEEFGLKGVTNNFKLVLVDISDYAALQAATYGLKRARSYIRSAAFKEIQRCIRMFSDKVYLNAKPMKYREDLKCKKLPEETLILL